MFPYEQNSTFFISFWSLACVGVVLVCSFLLGRLYTLANEPRRLRLDRERTLKALMSVMNSTNQLNQDVDTHNSALGIAQQQLKTMETTSQLGGLQSTLMDNITKVVQSNRQLESDLVVSRYQFENQAQELDSARKEARVDSLCQIGNRKAVDETLQFLISRSKAGEYPFGLMLIDIDHFKRINDTYGHQAGDTTLASIAQALDECVRDVDFVGRLGGDEFALMLFDVNAQNAEAVGMRIRKAIEQYDFKIDAGGQTTVVTMSMGMAVCQPGDTCESLYQRADQALYKSKDLGRNRLCTIVDSEQVSVSTKPIIPDVSYEEFKASVLDQPS